MPQLLSDNSVNLSSEERRAVRRVLKLADDYLLANTKADTLVAARGGMMTWRELRQHIKAASALLNPRNAKPQR